MPGLTHTLDIARRAMSAQQSVLSVIGHNVANTNTPGYCRQVATLAQEVPSPWGAHGYGNGVSVESIQRRRDACLDHELRHDMTDLHWWETRAGKLSTLESILNEPSDAGLAAAMDAFWNSLSELSNDPDDMTRRASVREQGRQLAYRFQILITRTGQIGHNIDQEIQSCVEEFNLCLQDVQGLNIKIREAELRCVEANDLRDRRDVLLDQLCRFAPIIYSEREDGIISIRLPSSVILDEGIYRPLEAVVEEDADGQGRVTVLLPSGRAAEIEGGSIGALLELREETLPTYMEQIDTLAQAIITNVNALHGTGPARANFFAGTDAQDIAISPDIEDDLRNLNPSTSGMPGDNDIALAIAQLSHSRIMESGTMSPTEYWRSVVGRLGVDSREATFQQESLTLTTQSLEQRRTSVSGVNLDEEMARILVTQQAYMGAVKVLQAAGDMMDILLSI
ncbi:MAG: flagellar hook-associated protein FlgK [Candidatus Eisenbacteria sp.]|nr:flagellar hook-associated protein FlgK [Candidatus Eisenbacteria bacterium]